MTEPAAVPPYAVPPRSKRTPARSSIAALGAFARACEEMTEREREAAFNWLRARFSPDADKPLTMDR